MDMKNLTANGSQVNDGDWYDVPMCCGLGRRDTRKYAGGDYAGVSFCELVALAEVPESSDKDAAIWLIPSNYVASDARTHAIQRKHGQFWLLPLDIDRGNPSLELVISTVRAIIGPEPTLVAYSTHSATPEDQRWRIMVPMAVPVMGPDWRDTAQAYYDLVADGSCGLVEPDTSLARPGQVTYLPNAGAHYVHHIEPAGELVPLVLTPDHPIIARREANRAARAEAEKTLSQRALERMQKAQDRKPGKDVIAAFNDAHDIAALLHKYGYKHRKNWVGDEDWRSPHQDSQSYATRVFEGSDGEYWISLSGSDRKAGLGIATKSGSGSTGDAFDLFVHYEHGGNFNAAVADYAATMNQKPPITDEQRARVAEMVRKNREPKTETEPTQVIENPDFDPDLIEPGNGPYGPFTWVDHDGGPIYLTEDECRAVQHQFGKPWQDAWAEGESWLLKRRKVQQETERLERDDPAFAEYCRELGFVPGEVDYETEAVLREDLDNMAAPPLDLWGNFEAPALPLGLLPKVIEDFAVTQARLKGVEPGAFAVAALACSAAALDDGIVLRPKVNDPDWLESARLWVLLVGDASARKSPVIKRASKPLGAEHKKLMQENDRNIAKWEALPKDEKGKTPKPALKWLILKDSTPEANQELFKNAPKGLFMVQDEMSRFFGSMNQYKGGKGGDRGYWVASYDGDDFSANRISRGHISVPKLSMSLLGAVQPEVIHKVAEMTEDDGLVQRMLPVVMGPSGVDQDLPSGPEGEAYDMAVANLYDLHMPKDVPCLTFTEGAQAIRQALAAKNHKLKALAHLSQKLAEHIGKHDGVFARLCIVWHCLEHLEARQNVLTPLPKEVTQATAERVVAFMERFIVPQAISFYGSVIDLGKAFDKPQSVAAYILTKGLSKITLREARVNVRALQKLTPKEAEDVMTTLVQFGWLEPKQSARKDSKEWTVNPAVHQRFEDRACIEAERIERIKEGMQHAFAARKAGK